MPRFYISEFKQLIIIDFLSRTSVRMRDWNLDEKHECLDDLCSPEPIDVDVEEVIFYNHSFLPNTNESVNNKLALLRLVKEIKYSGMNVSII